MTILTKQKQIEASAMTLDIPENQTIDQGIYPATLTKLELKEIEKGEYAGNTIRVWTFQVDVDGVPEKVEASSSLAFGSKSKAYGWFLALVGRPPVFGEKGVKIVGLPCRLHLIVNDDGYNKVAAVLPADKGQKAAAAAVAPPSAPDDDLPPMEEPPLYSQEDMP